MHFSTQSSFSLLSETFQSHLPTHSHVSVHNTGLLFFFLGKLFKGSSLHFKDMIYRISNQFISFFRKMDGFILSVSNILLQVNATFFFQLFQCSIYRLFPKVQIITYLCLGRTAMSLS